MGSLLPLVAVEDWNLGALERLIDEASREAGVEVEYRTRTCTVMYSCTSSGCTSTYSYSYSARLRVCLKDKPGCQDHTVITVLE